MSDDYSGFFDDEEVNDIAQSHAEAVGNLEESEVPKILKNYKRVRQDLRDRLDAIPKGTFTAQRMQGTLMQLDAAIKEMSGNLLDDFGLGAITAATDGIQNLLNELKIWNKKFDGSVVPINLNVVAAATDTKNFLFNQYDSSIQSYNQLLRQRMAQSLTQSVIAQDNTSDVISSLGKVFMGEEWKLQQIVRTELHNVYNVGKLRGMSDLWDEGKGDIPDLKKTLYHPMDKRTGKDSVYLSQHNPVVSVDEPFVEYSLGYRSEYMAPPNRPNDRAILIPFRESWTK